MLIRTALLVAAAASLFVNVGCGRLVGRMDYLDTSMSTALASADDRELRGRPAVEVDDADRDDVDRRIPREGLILPDLHDPEEDDDDVVQALPEHRERVDYVLTVFRELGQLQHQLIQIAALADQKGAPAQAALDGKVRAFLMDMRLIARNALDMRRVNDDEWQSRRTKIETHLENARSVVREAAEEVEAVPARGSFIT